MTARVHRLVTELEAILCNEADKENDDVCEHMYELFNYIEDWEAVYRHMKEEE
jgi:hypothetical protein